MESSVAMIDDATIAPPAMRCRGSRATSAPPTVAADRIVYHLPTGDSDSATRRRRDLGRKASRGERVRSTCADARVALATVTPANVAAATALTVLSSRARERDMDVAGAISMPCRLPAAAN